MMEDTYVGTKSKVPCGQGVSGAFEAKVDLRQGSVLSSRLFIAVAEVISRKNITKHIIWMLSKNNCHSGRISSAWNEHYFGAATGWDSKTKNWTCTWRVNKRTQRDSFVCLRGMTCWDGNQYTAVSRTMDMRRWNNKRMCRFQL